MYAQATQFSSLAKANAEAQLALLSALTGKAVETVEKVAALNLNALKATLEDSSITAKQLLATKEPQEFFSLTAAQTQPAAAKAIAYGRQLAGIVGSAQAEFGRAAEEQLAEAGRRLSAAVEAASKNAPAGSENVFAFVQSALGNAQAGYEQFSRNARQAAEAVEANVNSAVSQFSQAAEKTTGRARK
jgi:phasin family protein